MSEPLMMGDAMSEQLDLAPIKARLAAATPGAWKWRDLFRPVPYEGGSTFISGREEGLEPGNDGSLGLSGLFVGMPPDVDSWIFEPIIWVDQDEEIPVDPNDPNQDDLSKWRGSLKVRNLADLDFIALSNSDIAALIAEVERLRGVTPESEPEPDHDLMSKLRRPLTARRPVPRKSQSS